MSEYQNDRFEWTIEKSDDRKRRSGFGFDVASDIFSSDRYVVTYDEAHSEDGEEHIIATGMLGTVFVSVIYVERGARKRIISAFPADEEDIRDYMETYAIEQ